MTDPPWPKALTLWRPGISQNPPKRYHLLSLSFSALFLCLAFRHVTFFCVHIIVANLFLVDDHSMILGRQ